MHSSLALTTLPGTFSGCGMLAPCDHVSVAGS
jgi:hypothetical protein